MGSVYERAMKLLCPPSLLFRVRLLPFAWVRDQSSSISTQRRGTWTQHNLSRRSLQEQRLLCPCTSMGCPLTWILSLTAQLTTISRSLRMPPEAHGAEYFSRKNGNRWMKCGNMSDVGCFSFYANKILTTGEGGMVVTNDPSIAAAGGFVSEPLFSRREAVLSHRALLQLSDDQSSSCGWDRAARTDRRGYCTAKAHYWPFITNRAWQACLAFSFQS